MLRMSSQLPRGKQYYFAYGSNLHLKQMASRCPGSKYIGRAILPHYRWQINQRGFANVVHSDGSWVEGLVYELSVADERQLDRSEGVAKECYSKAYETVELHRAPIALYRRPVPWIVNKGGPGKVLKEAKLAGKLIEEQKGATKQVVLAYISFIHRDEGIAREEYVGRINHGVADSIDLGISKDYISSFIRRYIPSPDSRTPPGAMDGPFAQPPRDNIIQPTEQHWNQSKVARLVYVRYTAGKRRRKREEKSHFHLPSIFRGSPRDNFGHRPRPKFRDGRERRTLVASEPGGG